MTDEKQPRTAGEAGWHVSRYNVSAPVPDTKNVAIANLFKGTCAEYTPLELYLLSVLEELDENHPIIPRFAKRGIIVNFDERMALEVMGRGALGMTSGVSLTVCTTLGCNFDCPYCFEDHGRGKMTPEVQDDIVALAKRMIEANRAKHFSITWFGGEPLLAPDVIESLSERFIALAEEYGIPYHASIITNGYMMSQEVIDLLDRAKVHSCQVTIDGMGATHDATRYLVGGGPTFDRIVSNLRDTKIPFSVQVRHNVHEGNRGEMDELKSFIEKIAEESGNDLEYYPAPVAASAVADERGVQVGLLCESNESDVSIRQEAGRFQAGRGHYCGAHTLWNVGIDDRGNLYKCWEAVDKPHLSFGTAHDWDPVNPLETATHPDHLMSYLNTAIPVPDKECMECVWLPTCVGGCPFKRLYDPGVRSCVAFKDNPEAYVLALHARIGEDKKDEEEKPENAQ